MTILSEYSVIWVDGIGAIGQYNNYQDCFYENCVIYFVRDYFCDLALKENTTNYDSKIISLNSKIQEYENMPKIITPKRQNASWADMEDAEKEWQDPKNPVPIPVHRQFATREEPTNPFTLLQDEAAHASSSLQADDHQAVACEPPSSSCKEAPPKKKPPVRKSKAKPASQP